MFNFPDTMLFQFTTSPFFYVSWTNNYIDNKAKCRHLKNWSVKGLCGWCLSELIDWRYGQSCWYFRHSFVNCCPLTFSLVQLPPPLSCVKVQRIQTVCGWEGVGGVESCWSLGDHILQEVNTVSDQIQKLQNCKNSQTKNLADKHLQQSPFTGHFF